MITRIIIGRDGKVTIEGIGYQGDQCLIPLNQLIEYLQSKGVSIEIEKHERKTEAVWNAESEKEMVANSNQ